MPNIESAKKAVRSSAKKRDHNLFWKARIKKAVKALDRLLDAKNSDPKILSEHLMAVQKVSDKASKEKVISKNKANRLKSRYAQKISERTQNPSKPKVQESKRVPAKKKK